MKKLKEIYKSINWSARRKNIVFWLGLFGVFFSSANIELAHLTSWKLFWNAILQVIENPARLITTTIAVIGIISNPTSKGIGDNPIKNIDEN